MYENTRREGDKFIVPAHPYSRPSEEVTITKAELDLVRSLREKYRTVDLDKVLYFQSAVGGHEYQWAPVTALVGTDVSKVSIHYLYIIPYEESYWTELDMTYITGFKLTNEDLNDSYPLVSAVVDYQRVKEDELAKIVASDDSYDLEKRDWEDEDWEEYYRYSLMGRESFEFDTNETVLIVAK